MLLLLEPGAVSKALLEAGERLHLLDQPSCFASVRKVKDRRMDVP